MRGNEGGEGSSGEGVLLFVLNLCFVVCCVLFRFLLCKNLLRFDIVLGCVVGYEVVGGWCGLVCRWWVLGL